MTRCKCALCGHSNRASESFYGYQTFRWYCADTEACDLRRGVEHSIRAAAVRGQRVIVHRREVIA